MEYRRLGGGGLESRRVPGHDDLRLESKTFMRAISTGAGAAECAERARAGGGHRLLRRRAGEAAQTLGAKLLGPAEAQAGGGATRVRTSRWCVKPRPNEQGLSRRHIVAMCEDSLRRLGTDYIDYAWVHMQDRAAPIGQTLRARRPPNCGREGSLPSAAPSCLPADQIALGADRRNLAATRRCGYQWSLRRHGAEREVVPACKAQAGASGVGHPVVPGTLRPLPRAAAAAWARLAEWKDTWKSTTDAAWKVVEAGPGSGETGATPARVALKVAARQEAE